jgi:hypothetical protein
VQRLKILLACFALGLSTIARSAWQECAGDWRATFQQVTEHEESLKKELHVLVTAEFSDKHESCNKLLHELVNLTGSKWRIVSEKPAKGRCVGLQSLSEDLPRLIREARVTLSKSFKAGKYISLRGA